MKKQIALLVSLALTVSSFGISAWADEIEVSEPVIGVGTEIVTPIVPTVEEVDEVFSDFGSEDIEIEVTEDIIEVEDLTATEESEDDTVDAFEMGASAMLSGSGEEVFVGEETSDAPAVDNYIHDETFESYNVATNYADALVLGKLKGTQAYSKVIKEGENKVLELYRWNPNTSYSSYMGFMKFQGTGAFSPSKTGIMEASVKFKMESLENAKYYPITFNAASSSIYAFYPTVWVENGTFYVKNNTFGQSGGDKNKSLNVAAQAGVWYELKIKMYVDGNAETRDSYDFAVTKVSDGTTVVSGEDVILGPGFSGQGAMKNTGLTQLGFGGVIGTAASSSPKSWIDDIHTKYTPAQVKSATFKDGDKNVSPVDKIEIEFTQYMKGSTFSNITITDKNGDPALDAEGEEIVITPKAVSATKCELLLSEILAYESKFKLVIPADKVEAQNGDKCAATVINFETGVFVYETPIDSSVKLDDTFDSSATDDTTSYGRNSAAYEMDNTLNSTVLKYKKYVGGTSNNVPYFGYTAYPKVAFSPLQTGTFKLSVKFKADDVVNDDIFPITLKPAKDSLAEGSRYGVTPFVYINNGRFYQVGGSSTEADKEIARAENNVWYELSVNITIDGDKNTNDLFSYELKRVDGADITEGTKTLTGENLVYGRSAYAPGTASYNGYDNEGIKRIYFGGISSELGSSAGAMDGYSNGFVYIDDAKVIKYDVPEMTVSIADGATGVSVNEQLKLTFDQKVNSADFAKITLKQGDNFVTVTPDAKDGYTKTCTLKTSALEYNREYTLTIPAMKNQGGIPAKPMTIKFTTEKKPADVAISNVKVNGVNSESASYNFTPGSDITINANYQNAIASESKASLFVQLVNANGEVVKIGYEDVTLSANANGNIQAKVTIPQDIGAGAKVYIFAWDSIQTMTPVSNVVCIE